MSSLNDIIRSYEDKIETIQAVADQQIQKYRHAIEALKELPEYEGLAEASESESEIHEEMIHPKKTLNQKVLDVLNKTQLPLTSRDLMENVNASFPDKEYEFNKWSGSFSQMYQKPKSGIKKFSLENMPVHISAFYCLDEWFEENELKIEYLQKISKNYNIAITNANGENEGLFTISID